MENSEAKSKAKDLITRAIGMIEGAGLDPKEVIDSCLEAEGDEAEEAAAGDEMAESRSSADDKARRMAGAVAVFKMKKERSIDA